MKNRIDAELANLVKLAESGPARYVYAMDKAQGLAAKDALTWNELPLLLSNALRSRRHGPPRKSSKGVSNERLRSIPIPSDAKQPEPSAEATLPGVAMNYVLRPIYRPSGTQVTGYTRTGILVKQEEFRVEWETVGLAADMAEAKRLYGGYPVLQAVRK